MFFNSNEISLILQLFEIRETLLENKIVKFRAGGICMFPCIQPGDNLYIEHKNIEQIKIGDIAVYRRMNRLFAHRTIAKGKDNNFDYIITRSDLGNYGNDGLIFAQDILGVVYNIESKGKLLGTEKRYCGLLIRLFLHICLKLYYLGKYLFGRIIYIISYIQQFKIYQKVANVLSFRLLLGKKISFLMHIPLNSKTNGRFYRIISPERFMSYCIESNKEFVSEWALTMNLDSRPAGFLAFTFKSQYYPFSGWWISKMKMRGRYRRTVIEKMLFQRADELLGQLGISEVFVGISKDEHLERKIFRNLGFKEIENKNTQFCVQIIMLRKVKGDS